MAPRQSQPRSRLEQQLPRPCSGNSVKSAQAHATGRARRSQDYTRIEVKEANKAQRTEIGTWTVAVHSASSILVMKVQ